jgi:hypothetical protein
MGTNYYRIPTEEEMKRRKGMLTEHIENMEMKPHIIENEFRSIEDPNAENPWDNMRSPWEIFINNTAIHLGKRSMGWLFSWNFHKKKFYSNKEELLKFIRSGRVVNEYGDEVEVEEFIKMALEWCQPDGWYICETYYKKQFDDKKKNRPMFSSSDHYDTLIDGLRVSSSSEFC